jgi:uncharacterized protein
VRILLTGSSGLIGRRLHWRLRRDRHDVIRLRRDKSDNYESGVVHFLDDREPDLFLLDGFDAVIHLAGADVARRWTPWRKRLIMNSRAGFTERLCDALAQTHRPPKHFLCASGVGYYGHQSNGTLDESSPNGDGFLADVCRRWEGATAPLAELPADLRPRIAFLRIAAVLSPESGAVGKFRKPFRHGLGAVMGSGRQVMSWISLTDVVEAIVHVLNTPALAGPVNVTAPNPVTNREFTAALAKALGSTARLRLPAAALRLMFGRMATETILASQNVSPAKLLATGFAFRHARLDAALADLFADEA